ncbi:MAG: VWA domain-containing protein [Segniliparus sp.]|uniref:VWA domain-containing protein n=1 Tax=Segniliparus sp. TaxID=2804064 RepID=UPI003F3798D1
MSAGLVAAAALVVLALRVFTLYHLLVHKSGGRLTGVLLRWGALTLAILCVFVAALRPGSHHTRQELSKPPPVAAPSDDPQLNIFLVVDRSPNSWVDDFGPKHDYRMVGIRADLKAIVHQFPHANFSVIAFSAAARVDWPLSADTWSLEAFLENYSAFQVVQGAIDRVDPTAASGLLNQGLQVAQQQYPRSHSLVFYLGEGRRGQAVPQGAFAPGPGLVSGGAVLGYGSAAGGQVPDRWGEDRQMVHLQGPDGPLVATPDEGVLRQIAAQLSVPYSHRSPGDPIAAVVPVPPEHSPARSDQAMDEQTARAEYYWVFAMIAAALLAVEAFLLIREIRRDQLRGAA